MNIEVWPFLISRNKVFDYRAVVAPKFVVENKIASLLVQATEGNVTEPGYVMYREIRGSKVGDISLFFRIMRAQNRHIGLEGDEELKDRFGRAIDLIEGLVIRGQIPEIMITDSIFLQAHEQMEPDYRAFWEDTIRTPAVRLSKSFELPVDGRQDGYLKVKTLETIYITPEVPLESKRPQQMPPQQQPASQPEETVRNLIDKGKSLLNAKRYDEALATFEQAIKLDPHLAFAYKSIGDAYYYSKQYKKALDSFNKAIHYDPNSASAYNGKGNSLYVLERYPEALHAYEEAIKRDPDFVVAHRNKGNALYTIGRYPEAVRAYEEAIKRDPNNAYAYCDKGDALYMMRYDNEAKAAYKQALDLQERAILSNPDVAKLYYFKGTLLEKLGRRREAEEAKSKAWQLEKRDM